MDGETARGVLLGLACGDALGRPVEGVPRELIERRYGRLTEMRGDGAHGLPAGSITDDTEMALCLARSLVDCAAWDPDDAAGRFVEWFRGDPTGIGGMTYRVLSRVADGAAWRTAAREVWEASPEGRNAGNGSLMRCAPVAVAFDDVPERLVTVSRESSMLTHWDPRCRDSCVALNAAIAAAGRNEDPIDAALDRLGDDGHPAVVEALHRSSTTAPEDLPVTGYVVDTLAAAFGHARAADAADATIISAVNNGGDADTIGAVTGALAGARDGVSGLRSAWLDDLASRDEIGDLADALVD